MDQEMIENFLGKYGQAISTGDTSAIARCWEVPSLVLSDQGERIAAVDVRWPAFDRAGVEKFSEHSYYILRLGDDGQPRIRAAITRA